MNRKLRVFAGFAATCLPLFSQAPDLTEHFEKNVRPVFATKCAACHNTKTKMGGLDLSSGEAFAKSAETGALLSAENPDNGRFLRALSWEDKLKMPPTGKLGDADLQAIALWVRAGAPWPGSHKAPPTGKTETSLAEKRKFWAFQPIKTVSPPIVKDASWAASPIDRFILAKLDEKGVKPASQADKFTLLRRATFDLIGLPPTEAEILEFQNDSSPQAFSKVVDRLLASPRYGEKWGRHWLDVARYADSTGNDEDHRYPYAWRYRDYVIDSFNSDVPYDQFVREQVAGDLLPSEDGGINRRGIIATGLLALGPKAVAQQDKKKMLYDVYDEQIDVLSKSILGLTIACARCHDHKFDPISTKDYYALTSVFASTRSFEDPALHVSKLLFVPLVPAEVHQQYKREQDEIRTKQLAAEDVVELAVERYHKDQATRIAEYMVAAKSAGGAPGNLQPELLERWKKFYGAGLANGPYMEAWIKASPENITAVAMDYQEKSLATLAGWTERLQRWRTSYKEAVKAMNMPPPPRPAFDASSDRFFSDVFMAGGPFSFKKGEREKLLTETQRAGLKKLRAEVELAKKNARPEPDMACAVREGEPVQQHVLVRGDYGSPGEPVAKGFPLVLTRNGGPEVKSVSGRLELAQWLTDPKHPLTARWAGVNVSRTCSATLRLRSDINRLFIANRA